MKYPSKKDAWILALLFGGMLIPLIIGIFFLFLPGIPAWTAWLVILIGLVTGGSIFALIATTYYEITSEALVVRSGWLHRKIALNSIQQVFPTRNPLSAPAFSLDRLQVDYTTGGQAGFVLISPEDKFRFMHDLAAYAEGLEVRDGRVVRRQLTF